MPLILKATEMASLRPLIMHTMAQHCASSYCGSTSGECAHIYIFLFTIHWQCTKSDARCWSQDATVTAEGANSCHPAHTSNQSVLWRQAFVWFYGGSGYHHWAQYLVDCDSHWCTDLFGYLLISDYTSMIRTVSFLLCTLNNTEK